MIDMRKVYFLKCGGDPEKNERPTSDQLTAFRGKLRTGKAPHADFTVWTLFGATETRHARRVRPMSSFATCLATLFEDVVQLPSWRPGRLSRQVWRTWDKRQYIPFSLSLVEPIPRTPEAGHDVVTDR